MSRSSLFGRVAGLLPHRSSFATLVLAFVGFAYGAPAMAALDVSMSVAPGYANPINPGDVTAFRISLTNSDPTGPVTGVAFIDSMPAALKVAGVGLKNFTCTDGAGTVNTSPAGTIGAAQGSSTITLSGGSVPPAVLNGANGRCDIDVEVTSLVLNSAQVNTIAANAVTGTDNGGVGVSNVSPAQQSINVNNIALPVISKSFSAATVLRNEGSVRLSIQIRNPASVDLPLNGAGDSPAFAIRDSLPTGLQVAATPNAGATCTGSGTPPTFAPVAGATTLQGVGGTVAAGGTCTLAVDVTGTTTNGHYSNTVNNVISRSTDFANQRGLVPTADATASLSVVSLLQVSKQFAAGVISANQPSTLTITLRNAGASTSIPLVSLSDSPIDGVGNFANGGLHAGTPSTTCPGSVAATGDTFGVIYTGAGSLAPGASCTITVPFTGTLQTPGTPQSFTNTIAEGAVNTGASGVVSQLASASVTVVDRLLVDKTSSPQFVAPGNPIRYVVTVNNYSSSPMSNVVVHDALPAGVIGLPALAGAANGGAPSISGTSCTLVSHDIPPLPGTNNDLHFTIGTLPAGSGAAPGVCTITFWAMLPKGAATGVNVTNQLPAGSVGVGGIFNSNVAGAAASVSDALAISKVFNPSNAFEGTVSVLTLTLTNTTASTISNLQFTDTLPLGSGNNQLRVASPADASTSCAGGTVTADPGTSVISLAGASLAGRSGNGTGAFTTCQVQVKVIGAADSYINTLPAGALTGASTYADGSAASFSSPGPISASLVYGAALQASKSFNPTTISAGGRSTVRVSMGNIGTGTLNNASVIDPLPANMTLASPTNAYSTCGGTPVITAVAGSSSASIAGAVLPPNGRCDFLFDVTGTGGAAWVNTIPVGNVTATGGVRNTTVVAATLNNSTAGAVSVTNNTSPNNLSAPGQSSVLTVNIQNGGSINLSGLTLTNFFTVGGLTGSTLTGMQLSSSPALATTCQGGIVSAGADGASITLSNANLAAGQSCAITANVTMTTTGTVQDTIPVGAIVNDQGISNTTLTVTSLSASGNIGVVKTFIPPVVKPGSVARLRLTFLNSVALPLTNMAATDNLPVGMTVASNPNVATTCTGATVTTTSAQVRVTGGSLPAAAGGVAQSCVAEADVVAAAQGAYPNVIAAGDVTGTIGGGNASNPAPGSATLQVRNPAGIAKAFAPAQVAPGTPSTATITISNGNAIQLTSSRLTDALPANVVVAQTPNASTTCAGGFVSAPVSATSVTLTGGIIPANGSCVVKFDVVSNIAGIYTNTIPAGGLSNAEGVTNENPASATLTLLDPPSVNKQFNPVAIASGGISTLSIVLGNTNATAATLSADLIDTLPTSPGPIVVAPTPNLGGTCTNARVTATAGAGTVTYGNGATIPAGGCVITVDVTGTTAGTYNNFIATGALKTNAGNNVQPASANLSISTLGFISGKVFRDNNVTPNGTFEQGTDAGIANVIVQLTGTSYGADGIAGTGDDVPVSKQALTDALGNYAFVDLQAGNYLVTEPNQPGGTNNGITTAGAITGGSGTPGVATAVSVTPSRIAGIILQRASGGQVSSSPNNNFAEVAPSSISGVVFLDQNNDGLKALADTAIAGVSIELLNAGGTVVATTTSDATGAYSFTNLAAGVYSVREPNQPADTANGMTVAGLVGNGGTPGSVTSPASVPSRISNIVLPPGTSSTGNNFAEIPSGRQVSGRVFADGNNDGLFNNSDSGLSGVVINLTGTDSSGNPVSKTTTTGADGRYSFSGLPEGTYTVTEPTQPARTLNGITTPGTTGGAATPVGTVPSVISGINLSGTNTTSVDNNFAEVPILVGAVSGKVYVDTNGNGVVDAGETGIAGVTVKLSGTDANGNAVNLATTTAGDGSYSFANLQPSNGAGYVITEIQPPLYADGRTTIAPGNPGVAGSAKPVLSNNTDIIRNVVVAAADDLKNYNFGEGGAMTLRPPLVNGYVYLDNNHSRVRPNDGSSSGVGGWTVRLTQGGTLICTVSTDANGFYQFDNLHCPGYEVSGLPTGANFEINFSRDGNTLPQTPTSGDNRGNASSGGKITGITLSASDEVVEQNLPLDPSGVVYDSQTRQPVAGATVTISGPAGFNPATHLVGGSASQVTGSDGFYQFLLQNAFPNGVYTLTVTSPGGYLPAPSTSLPPCNGTVTVGAVPTPALVQASNSAPASSVPAANPAACAGIVAGGAATTQYYMSFVITAASADILNNHIPLDQANSDVITVFKTTPMVNVSRGDLVPYTITATNNKGYAISGVTVRDQVPAGFKYRTGSATYNGARVEPAVSGRLLSWPGQSFAPNEKKVYRLILVVGSGVGDGTYINQAWAASSSNSLLSRIAQAPVRIVPDPTFDCPDIIGKVFDDQNANGYQDQGEPGIPAVRVVTPRGLLVMTDSEGRFHVPCPDIPNQDRGSNFVMKLDERTLPSGYRVTTENPRDVRITRGKVTKLNFGATIHRVVRLELSDAAFDAGKAELQPQWQKQVDALPRQLKERPSVVRLAYQRGADAAELVRQRTDAIRRRIEEGWHAQKGAYTLNIEIEDAQ